jgi:hypothetical protein
MKTTMESFLFHKLHWRLEGKQTLPTILEFQYAKFISMTFIQIMLSKMYN